MPSAAEIRALVERVVNEVFDEKAAKLRAAIASKVAEQLETELGASPGAAPSDLLNAAVNSLHDSTAQTDILRALLEGAARFSGRSALFVVKGGNVSGWQSRGFEREDAVKSVSFDATQGLAGRAINDRTPVAAAATEFNSAFIEANGNPNEGNALVLPLIIKDKVAALLYADAGTAPGGSLDSSAVQLLANAAATWLEICALRKAGVTPSHDAEPPQAMAAAASPAPAYQAAPPMQVVAPLPEPAPLPPPPVAAPAPAAAPVAESTDMAPEDAEVHKKAKRFAKLLVDEIKLYNQKDVDAGRQNKDLYDRLREAIDKSRMAYDSRYKNTSAASADYFNQEVIRILANNDPSLLGATFPR
jgi:hypothetical protein